MTDKATAEKVLTNFSYYLNKTQPQAWAVILLPKIRLYLAEMYAKDTQQYMHCFKCNTITEAATSNGEVRCKVCNS